MPVVYVAGPYRASTPEGVQLNIQAASHVGQLACRKGWVPIVPHLSLARFDMLTSLGDQFFRDAAMELLTRADAVVLAPGWQHSEGTKADLAKADALGLPIYRSEHELPLAEAFLDEEADRLGQLVR